MDVQVKDIIDKLLKILKVQFLARLVAIPMLDYGVFKHVQILAAFAQHGDYVRCCHCRF